MVWVHFKKNQFPCQRIFCYIVGGSTGALLCMQSACGGTEPLVARCPEHHFMVHHPGFRRIYTGHRWSQPARPTDPNKIEPQELAIHLLLHPITIYTCIYIYVHYIQIYPYIHSTTLSPAAGSRHLIRPTHAWERCNTRWTPTTMGVSPETSFAQAAPSSFPGRGLPFQISGWPKVPPPRKIICLTPPTQTYICGSTHFFLPGPTYPPPAKKYNIFPCPAVWSLSKWYQLLHTSECVHIWKETTSIPVTPVLSLIIWISLITLWSSHLCNLFDVGFSYFFSFWFLHFLTSTSWNY